MLISLPGLASVLPALLFAAVLVVIFVAAVRLDVRAERRRALPGLNARRRRYSLERSSFRAAELMQ